MGLFDMFKKKESPPPEVSLPQLCYDIAYFILPQYVYQDFAKLEHMCRESPELAGLFCYFMACRSREMEPDASVGKTFCWHLGQFNNGPEHFTLAFPPPPAIDMGDKSLEEILTGDTRIVLAPHFSCVLRNRSGEMNYFILGQAPMGGGTTMRCITSDGKNCNLGSGPTPNLEQFLARVESMSREK